MATKNVRYFADRCRVVVVYNVAFKTGNTMKHTTTTAHSTVADQPVNTVIHGQLVALLVVSEKC